MEIQKIMLEAGSREPTKPTKPPALVMGRVGTNWVPNHAWSDAGITSRSGCAFDPCRTSPRRRDLNPFHGVPVCVIWC